MSTTQVALVHIDEAFSAPPDYVGLILAAAAVPIELTHTPCALAPLTPEGGQPTLLPDRVRRATADADIVWVFGGGKMDAEVVRSIGPRCKAIIRSGSGTDNIHVDTATAR